VANTKDDLEAVRSITEALDGFNSTDQERIIRWAMEKIGLAVSTGGSRNPGVHSPDGHAPPPALSSPRGGEDIKTFVNRKDPRNDMHFSATVAYYYKFEAPPNLKKDEINGEDLQEACRLCNRTRLTSTKNTLNNAVVQGGILDRGSSRGLFTINNVGENLVAMTLPTGNGATEKTARKRK